MRMLSHECDSHYDIVNWYNKMCQECNIKASKIYKEGIKWVLFIWYEPKERIIN